MSKQVGIQASLGTRSRDMRTVAVLTIVGWVLVSGGATGALYALYVIHPALLGLVLSVALIVAGASLKVKLIEDYDDEGKHQPYVQVITRERPGGEGK